MPRPTLRAAMGASGASTVSSSKVTAEIPVTLLTGGMKLAARRKALAAAASGEPGHYRGHARGVLPRPSKPRTWPWW